MEHLPATMDDDRVVALRGGTPPTLTETLAMLDQGLQQAANQMDDISLEIDAGGDRLRVRFRAYKHRNNGRGD